MSSLRALLDDAEADLAPILAAEDVGPTGTRALLDPIAAVVLDAESEVGLEPGFGTADLQRRRAARSRRTPVGPGFAARHRDELLPRAAADARAWFAERYAERLGREPADGWWRDDPASPLGGSVVGDAAELFDDGDLADFLAELEARYREEHGLPARGEGPVSQASLTRCVEAALPDLEVVREARLPWLRGQRLDIYVPALAIAIEHQGEQHFFALEHWGGEPGLAARRELDERKRDACARAGVRLIEWRYDEPISVAEVRERLRVGLT